MTDDWRLSGGYGHVWFRPQADWLEEDRVYAAAFFARRFEEVRSASRGLFEFRFFDYRENDLRFRNEFVVESHRPFPGTSRTPSLAQEFLLEHQR